MATFKVHFLFDETVTDRIIVTHDKKRGGYTASIRLVGAAEGYGVYSSGQTPEIAIDRALESAEIPNRWRRLAF